MNAAIANLINSFVLIGIGVWGYFESQSGTALIPVGAGAALMFMFPGIHKHNKTIAHIAVGLTLVLALMLIMPLKGAIEKGNTMAIVRTTIMIVSCAGAMFFFVKSFIDARKSREAAEASS